MPASPCTFSGICGQVLEVVLVHGFADPIASGLRGDGPARVVQRLEHLGRDMVRTIFVANDADHRDLAEARHPSARHRFR